MELLKKADSPGRPQFHTCYARQGQVIVPLVIDEKNIGSVLVCQALLQDPTEEHNNFLRSLGQELDAGLGERLVSTVSTIPVFTRAQLEGLGQFIQEQLLEKVQSRDMLEDTTEYLLEKYEELMFLYSITEDVSPYSEYRDALSNMLEKGCQKLSAKWGAFLLAGTDETKSMEILEIYGDVPWQKGVSSPPSLFTSVIGSCVGPMVLMRPFESLPELDDSIITVIICPFDIRRSLAGYLVFGSQSGSEFGDSELRFITALSNKAASILHTVHLYRDMADLLFATLGALASAIDAKDPYTHGHSQRVADYAVMTARHMGYDSKFLTMLKIAGQLHDFGKIGIREHILAKEGRLDEHESGVMREHPELGAQILEKFKPFSEIVPGIRHHHERHDGKGYPHGLDSDNIPMVGRVIAVVDAFDAMTTSRPYRKRFNSSEALEELSKNAGTQFDPVVVKAFMQAFERRRSGGNWSN